MANFMDKLNQELGKDTLQGLLESYKEIPRADSGIKENSKEEYKISLEKKAIQDMHRLLNYIEKKINRNLTEQDKKEVEDNLENWKKSIEILKKNI